MEVIITVLNGTFIIYRINWILVNMTMFKISSYVAVWRMNNYLNNPLNLQYLLIICLQITTTSREARFLSCLKCNFFAMSLNGGNIYPQTLIHMLV